jgi:hypothetical protein
VAVRAKNVGGLLSAYSAERSVVIVSASVLITRFDARPNEDGVRLQWQIEAGEAVLGFRVYRSAAGEMQRVLTDLPADATLFIDTDVQAGVAYTYVLAAVKEDGQEVRSIPVVAVIDPLSFDLQPNVPNPFNPTTHIGFSLGEPARAVLTVFDVRGSRVKTILDKSLQSGRHHADWNGTDARGLQVASGTYFYVLAAGPNRQSRKMVLLK